MNGLINKEMKTPIEIALQVDGEGRTTARKLYDFLELDKSNYSKWCKVNIIENAFAEKGIDYLVFVPKDENPKGGRPTTDYKLTASFAKKLAMGCQNKRGEEARIYFIAVEDKLKEVATRGTNSRKEVSYKRQKTIASVNNAAKIILPQLIEAGVDPIQRTYFLKDMYEPVGINVPMIRVEQEKLYEQTEMAEILGVLSSSRKPHAQAIGAILEKIFISNDEIVKTSFSRNGHAGTSDQYKEPVLHRVENWIIENGYPTTITNGVKNFQVVYRQKPLKMSGEQFL